MPNIYFYKLVVDDGGAPCVERGLLSLAICKPMLRSTAQVDDIVIGFAADSLHADNRLIYIARVSERLVNGEYFRTRSYFERSDCIYRSNGASFHCIPEPQYHGSIADLEHDLGKGPKYNRANTLVSRDFCYYGPKGTATYKKDFPAVAMAIERLGRGHRLHHSPKLHDELEALVKKHCKLKGACISGQPAQKPQCGVSHREGGSAVSCGRC
jgi:hypothetical protein